MKISKAFRDAFRTCFGRFGGTLGFTVAELCLILICLAPLLFLTDASMKILALISGVLLLILLPVIRVNAAGAMQAALLGESMLNRRIGDPTAYGEKLVCGLKRFLFLLLWSAPLIACGWIAYTNITGETDGFTVMRNIKSFGGGDLMTGVLYLGIIAVAAMLLVAVGCAFHCGARHAFVLGDKQLIKGHRGKLMLTWLCALVTILPLLIAIGMAVARYLPVLKDLNGLLYGTVNLPDTKQTLIILAIGGVLTIPLMPLRSMIIAAFVKGLKDS